MKRSTTPVTSLGLAQKGILIASTVLIALATPLAIIQTAKADSYDDQMSAIKQKISQYKSQANSLSKKVDSLQAELKRIDAQHELIQSQLRQTQLEYNQVTKQIKLTEQKISDNKKALGQILANMYVDGQTSPLEMLASSSNIADYVDQESFQKGLNEQLKQKISEVKELKATLVKKQKRVKVLLDRHKSQEKSLAAQEARKNSIIKQTKNKQSSYESLVSKSQNKLQSVSDQQKAFYARLQSQSGGGPVSGTVGAFSFSNVSPGNGAGGCAGGYPYCGAQDSMVDPWGLYNRECVSYVAWALENRFGKYVGNFNGQGNAQDWPSSAPAYSHAKIVSSPKRGDAVILPPSSGFAPIGHAMIVESVSGGKVHVSQFNFGGTGQYSTMDIGTGGVYFIRFQDK